MGLLSNLGALAVGAGAMYYGDPDQGSERRSQIKESAMQEPWRSRGRAVGGAVAAYWTLRAVVRPSFMNTLFGFAGAAMLARGMGRDAWNMIASESSSETSGMIATPPTELSPIPDNEIVTPETEASPT